MSSRALRRLQREEEERRLAEIVEQESNQDLDHESEEEQHAPASKPAKNAFDFLNAAEEDEDDVSEEEADDANEPTSIAAPTADTSSKKTKKKSKKKRKKSTKLASPEQEEEQDMDEIDQALKSLNTGSTADTTQDNVADPSLRVFYEILSTDSKFLNPLNEMKKLFGSTVLEGDREGNANRRRGRGPTQLDLGAALTGRHNMTSRGQGLAGLALRRNIFMLGKEEWPKATSGGLGMEVVEEASDFTIEYRFMHSSLYQAVQRQFGICVAGMDPQRMIAHLQLNPYHISTLLQVSEIAKHQGDNAVAVDLLERALFTFGRSAHSTFANSMAHGKARLDFRRPENREFWLAGYRYIGTLGQKGTWRTAFEWAKLLLSLDPEQDPYCMQLTIDQLAIRGNQCETFVKLAETPITLLDWGQGLPNIQLSLSLAYHKLKRPIDANDTFHKVVANHPWIILYLCRGLNIEPIPKAAQGCLPRTPREEFHAISYSTRAKDIWNTPDSLSFLKSSLESAPKANPQPDSTLPEEKVPNVAECRHAILTEDPELIGFLPRGLSTHEVSSSDPMPPEYEVRSYNLNDTELNREEWEEEEEEEVEEESAAAAVGNAGSSRLPSWFGNLLSHLGMNISVADAQEQIAVLERTQGALNWDGFDIDEITRQVHQMQEQHNQQRATQAEIISQEEQPEPTSDAPATATTIEPAPLQASVEEASDDDDDDTAPGPSSSSTSRPQPLLTPSGIHNNNDHDIPGPSTSTSSHQQQQEPLLTSSGGYDEEANKRWLVGQGRRRLMEFIAQHGSDENVWIEDTNIDSRAAGKYAYQIMLLKNNNTREWILKYTLRPGAGGAEAEALIRRLLA